MEKILVENPNRFVIFPIEHNDIWEFYKMHQAAFWTAEEVDLSGDIRDWENLSENEQYFVKNVLSFFAASDGIVNENLAENFYREVQYPEAKFFYGFQLAMENIHSLMYSLLIDTYFKDAQEKHEAFNAIQYIPCVKKKAEWCFKWINDHESSFAQRLLAFAIVEGVFFSGAFCSIFWLKERGLMPGLSFSNELISRDEGMHVEFAVLLFSMLKNKLPEETVHQIMKEAVEVEKNFITESIPCSMLGMNQQLMSVYIEFVADRLLSQLQYNKIWNVQNPFPFMERISIETKSNFFESRVSQYSKANVGSKQEHSTLRKFTLDADF